MDADGATSPTEAVDEIRGHLNWGGVGEGTTWKSEIWITIIVGQSAILNSGLLTSAHRPTITVELYCKVFRELRRFRHT